MVTLAEAAAAATREATRAKQKRPPSTVFYASLAWRRLRFRILAENAARNGGTARCELCGAPGAAGSPLNVDHIVPLSRDWSRRLDPGNLQILCAACNHGKLNGPPADFRPRAED